MGISLDAVRPFPKISSSELKKAGITEANRFVPPARIGTKPASPVNGFLDSIAERRMSSVPKTKVPAGVRTAMQLTEKHAQFWEDHVEGGVSAKDLARQPFHARFVGFANNTRSGAKSAEIYVVPVVDKATGMATAYVYTRPIAKLPDLLREGSNSTPMINDLPAGKWHLLNVGIYDPKLFHADSNFVPPAKDPVELVGRTARSVVERIWEGTDKGGWVPPFAELAEKTPPLEEQDSKRVYTQIRGPERDAIPDNPDRLWSY